MLARAKHHIQDVKSQVDAYIKSKPGTYAVEIDPDGFHKLHKVRFIRPPEIIANIVFDAANNLRATLDQAGYASAVAANSSSLKATKFPFAPDAIKFGQNVIGGCKDLPPAIRTLFASFKSYKGGNDILWAMNELCNTSKHLSLVPVSLKRGAMGWVKVTPKIFGALAPNKINFPKWDPEKHEIIFDRTHPLTDLQFDADSDLKFSVAVEAIEVVRSEPLIGILNNMALEVESILLATEAECRRVGFIV